MTLSSILLRFIFLPIIVGIFSAGMVEAFKRNTMISADLKTKWSVRGVCAFYCLLSQMVILMIRREPLALGIPLPLLLIMYFPSDYGIATVIYTHFFKPLHENR